MLKFMLDYLTFTLPVEVGHEFARRFIDDKLDLGYGGHGYAQSAIIYGCGRMYWHPDEPTMGVHFSFPAKALAAWYLALDARLPGSWGSVEVVEVVLDWGGVVRRFDVAFDDKTGLFSCQNVLDSLNAGHCVTRSRQFRPHFIGSVHQGGSFLQGLAIGSRQSETYVRVYDKRAQLQAAGVDGDDLPAAWVRVEIEYKGDRAAVLAERFVMTARSALGELMAGLLYGHLDFKEASETDSNKRRWSSVAWWAAFIGAVEKSRLEVEKRARSVAEIYEWISSQVAPSLAIVVEVLGPDVFDWLVKSGRERWRPVHKRLVAASRPVG